MANTNISLQKLVNMHTGAEVERWVGNNVENAEAFKPHRHDHYTCLLLEKGKIDIMLDSQPVTIKRRMLLYPTLVKYIKSYLRSSDTREEYRKTTVAVAQLAEDSGE